KRGVLARPEHAGRPRPLRRQRQGEPQSRRLEPRPRRPDLVQRLTSHSGELRFKSPSPLWGGGRGWGAIRMKLKRRYRAWFCTPSLPALPHKGGGFNVVKGGWTRTHVLYVLHL